MNHKRVEALLKTLPKEKRFEIKVKICLLIAGRGEKEMAFDLGIRPQVLSSCLCANRYKDLRPRIEEYLSRL